MEFINPQVIDEAKKELISSIHATLDLGAIGKILKDKYNLELEVKAELNDGDIVVYNNHVAYQLGFDAMVIFSILVDRMGNYRGLPDKSNGFELPWEKTAHQMNLTDSEIIKRKERELVDAIADALNPKDIGALFEQEHNIKLSDNAEYKQGNIVVSNNHAAYKFDFAAELKFSLLVDRNGNYLAFSDSNDHSNPCEEITDTYTVELGSNTEPSQITTHASST